MNGIQLRSASSTDCEAIYDMIVLLENEILDKSAFDEVFHYNVKDPSISYIIAVRHNQVVGFASLHIQLLLHHSGPVAEMQELIVHPSMRGLGIGARLTRQLKQIACEKNCRTFEVSCNIKREESHIFYKKQNLEQSHYKFIQKMGEREKNALSKSIGS